jgi:hypothetical protein
MLAYLYGNSYKCVSRASNPLKHRLKEDYSMNILMVGTKLVRKSEPSWGTWTVTEITSENEVTIKGDRGEKVLLDCELCFWEVK